MTEVRVRLLGGFEVAVDGALVPADRWRRRHPAALVKLLALAPGHRLHREQVIDAVWPDDDLDRAAAKLHKAAFYARQTLGRPDALVLRDEHVLLFPDADVHVDVAAFEALARTATASRSPADAEAALASYGGALAPDDRYEVWAEERREHLRLRHLDVLRIAERWDDLVELDPTDEAAHLALMRRYADAGDRHAALRQYERLDRALRRELGVGPSREAIDWRDRLLAAAPAPGAPRSSTLIGRERETAIIEGALGGRGSVVLLAAGAGMGKSTLLAAARHAATADDWRVGHGSASTVEAPWPYGAVVGALADMCRHHPALLDGLSDTFRAEIDRVLSGDAHTWAGDSAHQRLFVACAELVHLAAANRGLLLTIDDLHEADEATLRLLHYVARVSLDERVTIVAAYRPGPSRSALADVCDSLVARHGALEVELRRFGRDDIATLVRRRVGAASEELVDQIAALSSGVPFSVDELARRAAEEPEWVRYANVDSVGGLEPHTREVLQRVAVAGLVFDTDQFVALSGADAPVAYDHLDAALAAGVVESDDGGYRFRHGLVRDALLADLPPHRRRLVHRDAANRLLALGASPSRVGFHLLEAGEPRAAADHLLVAAESAAAVGAYRDALEMLEPVRAHASASNRARLLSLRADLLLAVGDPSACAAYRDALDESTPAAHVQLRTRLARAATMAGDLATAQAALEGISPDGGPLDGEILLAQAHVAFFTADFETAWAIATDAERRVLGGERSWQVLHLVSLLGMLAHSRGEWFDRMRVELRRTRDDPEIANAIFDGQLCAAQYVLYGTLPYTEVIELAEGLRATARRSGALRAVAFATTLIGECHLHQGDLDAAERELTESSTLHHDLDSSAGEAHALQRLAEVRLARGDRAGARALLLQAQPLARWSLIAEHLLQRIHGTLIAAAPDPATARAEVDRAEAALGLDDRCEFCTVMLAVPSAIACAHVGDLDAARRHLTAAETSAFLWQSPTWTALVAEAAGHVALAAGDAGTARARWSAAAESFRTAGQPHDAMRCEALATTT